MAVPLPPLNLNQTAASRADGGTVSSGQGDWIVSFGGDASKPAGVPWYVWAGVGLVAVLWIKKRKG